MVTSREIRLKSRPVGAPVHDNFELATVEVAAPGDGEIQVRNLWMDPDFKPGDIVSTMFGWREAFNVSPKALAAGGMGAVTKIDTHGLPPQTFLGVAGMPGLTAYVGLLRIAALKDGDVVFVSAAAGAVGQVVCQIAKLKGHTVIGSTGGPEKVAFLESIGVDHVIDYKATPDVVAELEKAAPKGIDVYFENVGGVHLEAALNSARPFGRFALCGMISLYNETGKPVGPWNIAQIVGKSLRLEGFIVSNHYDLAPQFLKDMAGWIGAGRIKWNETVEDGVERAPDAFIKLFKGDNLGKMLVKLG
ncbi:MAG: zinc-binding dehydrogenase [Caulobacter sp.]|nr:zinc-binding dehydrogenase [Caulobacter sp.]